MQKLKKTLGSINCVRVRGFLDLGAVHTSSVQKLKDIKEKVRETYSTLLFLINLKMKCFNFITECDIFASYFSETSNLEQRNIFKDFLWQMFFFYLTFLLLKKIVVKQRGLRLKSVYGSDSQPGCRGTLECRKEVSGVSPNFELLPFYWCFTSWDVTNCHF